MPRKNTVADVLSRFERNIGCWLWTGTLDHVTGYGRVSFEGKTHLAYRLVYTLMVGEIPDGLVLDHVCRNRACVRPDHLEPVTMRENIRRGIGWGGLTARKTHCVRGHALVETNLRPRNVRGETKPWRVCHACHRADKNVSRDRRAAAARMEARP